MDPPIVNESKLVDFNLIGGIKDDFWSRMTFPNFNFVFVCSFERPLGITFAYGDCCCWQRQWM